MSMMNLDWRKFEKKGKNRESLERYSKDLMINEDSTWIIDLMKDVLGGSRKKNAMTKREIRRERIDSFELCERDMRAQSSVRQQRNGR